MDRRLVSQPTTARRGVPSPEGTTSAWISTRIGRVPSTPAKTADPGAGRQPVAEEQLGGVGDLAQAVGGHLEHADLVGGAEAVLGRAQDAEGVAAVALEIEHGVDHVLDHLGAGDLAVLGDVADEQQRGALRLGVADQRLRGGAHLADGAGRGFERVGPQRLDRIDDDEVGALARRASVARMLATLVSQASASGACDRPSRSARRRTCAAASSPEK